MATQRGFDKRYCEDFQSDLSIEKIDTIWKNFREAGNSNEGRIAKTVPPCSLKTFKKIMSKFGYKDKFLDRLF